MHLCKQTRWLTSSILANVISLNVFFNASKQISRQTSKKPTCLVYVCLDSQGCSPFNLSKMLSAGDGASAQITRRETTALRRHRYCGTLPYKLKKRLDTCDPVNWCCNRAEQDPLDNYSRQLGKKKKKTQSKPNKSKSFPYLARLAFS